MTITLAGIDVTQGYVAPGSMSEIIMNLLMSVIDNPVKALRNANYIGILFWAVIFGLALKVADFTALNEDAHVDFYKILDAPNGYTGEFQLADDWPRGWAVKYAADGKSAYVYRQNGTQMIFR